MPNIRIWEFPDPSLTSQYFNCLMSLHNDNFPTSQRRIQDSREGVGAPTYYYCPQTKFGGKVMFLHLSVSHSVHGGGGGCLPLGPGGVPPWKHPVWTHLPWTHIPLNTPDRDGH